MRRAKVPTIVDVAATVCCLAVLLPSLAMVGNGGRQRAKRAVCLANMKQLTTGWLLFAEDHDGRLVNGEAGFSRWTEGGSVPPWVDRCWAADYLAGGQLAQQTQAEQIRRGALWPYVREVRLYGCPSGHPDQMLTCAIVDSMNGRPRSGTWSSVYPRRGVRIGNTVLWVTNTDEIIDPAPSERMVFVDVGWSTPDSFAVHCGSERWWDAPPVRHGDGTNVSFADGRAAYWPWRGRETIQSGRANVPGQFSTQLKPETPEGRDDLHRFQRAVWGRLGYEPTDDAAEVQR